MKQPNCQGVVLISIINVKHKIRISFRKVKVIKSYPGLMKLFFSQIPIRTIYKTKSFVQGQTNK